MGKKLFILIGCMAFMMLSSYVIFGQQGVLLPEKKVEHVHDENCDHDDEGACCLPGDIQGLEPIRAVMIPWPIDIKPRRGDISNPNNPNPPYPNFDPGLIEGPEDVNVIFGAGESSAIVGETVTWPSTAGTIFHQTTPSIGIPSILLGSTWAKNAVVAFADENGSVTGDIFDVKFYNNTRQQQNFGSGSGIGRDTMGWGGPGHSNYPGPLYNNGPLDPSHDGYKVPGNGSYYSSTTLNGYAVRLYRRILPYDTISDALYAVSPNYTFTTYSALNADVWAALASKVGTTNLDSAMHTNYYPNPYSADGYAGNGTIFFPVRIPDPTNSPFGLINKYEFFVPIYYHLNPYRIDIQTFTFEGEELNALYTSTKDNTAKDDGEDLIVRLSGPVPKSDFPDSIALKDYFRPTTLLISETNTFDSIAVSNVEWYAAGLKASPKIFNVPSIPGVPDNRERGYGYFDYNCAHFSGYFSYQVDHYQFDTTFYNSYRYVDAAVRLLDNADVCVVGNVSTTAVTNTDVLTNLGKGQDNITSAVLVLPGMDDPQGRRSYFRLKIGGDANILHTQDSGSYVITSGVSDPLYDNYFYSDSALYGGPGPNFPREQVPVWLSGGGANTSPWPDEVANIKWDYRHPREEFTLTYDENSVPLLPKTQWVPYASTDASVYGVWGNYFGFTDIHTRDIAGVDTTNIIEIGPSTANQDYFKIYSAGMLKNFRSLCTTSVDSVAIGVPSIDKTGTVGNMTAPGFFLSRNPDTTLYIIHDGDGTGAYDYKWGIHFNEAGIDSLNQAIANAEGGGDLHIQANSYVRFTGGSSLEFNLKKDNEIKVLSDQHSIYVEDSVIFTKADSAHLTFWAFGQPDMWRGVSDFYNDLERTGAIIVGGNVTVKYDTIPENGRGLTLLRSEYDDVLVGGKFTYENQYALDESAELMVQAGQDIRISGETNLLHDGQRSMLFEAHKTIAFEDDFTAIIGSRVPTTTTTDSIMKNGDLTIKAGYGDGPGVFLPTADVNNMVLPLIWDPSNNCVVPGYMNRDVGQLADQTGGDIWFKGNVNISLTPDFADSVDVFIRAYNSIYVDGNYQHTLNSTNKFNSGLYVDSTLTFAETGNYEAINSGTSGTVEFNFGANDSVYFLLQAGNTLGNPCGLTACDILPIESPWHGNVLFGEGKEFTINHDGVGPTLISASRDIENQVNADFTFTYTNPDLTVGDSVKITAGRHIETHAPYWFDFSKAGNSIRNDIMMQAGHQTADCIFDLCKAPELASNLAFNYLTPYPPNPDTISIFAKDGSGNGSILLFNEVRFDYAGKGNILMTALNGNIESDPYLHKGSGSGYPGVAPIIFNVDSAEGKVRMEAIDIKLHDILQYNGGTTNDLKNGQFYMAAFDSILTRNLTYINHTDTGSVFITTDKYKYTGLNDCGETDYTLNRRGIHQGHIVLGYGSDCDENSTSNDVIEFDFSTNPNTAGANLFIRAGYRGFYDNPITGVYSKVLENRPNDRGKGYGGNITFDFMKISMALGNADKGGYAEISTPNGNIWGKDSLQFHGINGDLRIDAGLGSLEDTLHAVRWRTEFTDQYGAGSEDMLNTKVPFCCDPGGEWRTGNIMLKGGSVDFLNNVSGTGTPGTGNVFFRTREGFIDVYDKFNATNMTGHLVMYAGITSGAPKLNEWGDVSQRDFQYTPDVNSGSVYFGADDNIMLNYGYSNGLQPTYYFYNPTNYGYFDALNAGMIGQTNPFYSTSYQPSIDACYSIFDVNVNGYLWYKSAAYSPRRYYHFLFRGCEGAPGTNQGNTNCSQLTGECFTVDNGARPLTFDFSQTNSGGLATVASNYIDMFTAFTYQGGSGTGIAVVPEMGTLKGEKVDGYGLYIKSLFNGSNPEKRHITCFECMEEYDYNWKEWPAITFHDDARIHTEGQKSLLEAPVIEFFGHAELDAQTNTGPSSKLTVKADSLIFHDSAIFAGLQLEMLPFTTNQVIRHASKESSMRYGVVNDDVGFKYYQEYGKAIQMPDRGTPVLEFGYQRCVEPPYAPTEAPNRYSRNGDEPTPTVGGDIIVAFKHGFALPIYNTIVANHARISFIDDLIDGVRGGEYVNTYIRTDLLRIRNKVEFYTDPDPSAFRLGTLRMTSHEQMPTANATGIYPYHLHLEPGSELSIPDEDSLLVIPTTTIGGFGEIHENIRVLANGIIAPGYASLMENDCQTGFPQGRLSVHNLYMEKDAIMRVSMSYNPNYCEYNPDTRAYDLNCTRMDTLHVQDSIFFFGRISLYVLIEDEYIEPGCYLFMEYNDLEASVEYVNNLVLMTTRHGDLHLALDKSERGRIYLCVTEFETPPVQRYVHIHATDGVKTDPVAEIYHYVPGHQDFVFTATYANKTALEVLATGYYSQKTTKLPASYLFDGTYEYRIRQVVEPYDVYFGEVDPDALEVGNEVLLDKRIWSYRNTLFINVDKEDIVSIYNVTGVLYQKLEIPAGLQKLTLDRGVYMVTLKNGTVHKIIIN